MLSTSNHLVADTIEVETDGPIVFTVEFQHAESGFAADDDRDDHPVQHPTSP
jgi:hypothetical protein